MNEKKIKQYIIYFGSVFLLLFCLFPFIWMLVISLSRNPDFLSKQSSFSFTFINFREILTNKSLHFMDYLKNSVIISIVTAVFASFFAGLSAYAVTRIKFPGRILIPTIILALSMFPQISIISYLFKMMANLGWINTYNALLLPYITLALPLALWIMLSYFSQLPIELDNAAMVDGANRFQTLTKVILPLSAPGVFSTMLLIFIFSFNEFLFALMLTVDYQARTIPVGIALFQGLHGQIPWGHIMAAAVLASIPLVILASVFQKYIVQGLTRGAVKG